MTKKADIREVSITSHIIETVSYDEFIGDLEAEVVNRHRLDVAGRFIEERANADGSGSSRLEIFDQVVHGQARVDDVFDDQDIFVDDGGREIAGQANDPRALGACAVRRDGKEIDDQRQIDVTGEIGKKEITSAQNADQDEIFVLIVLGDLRTEFLDTGMDLFLSKQDLEGRVFEDRHDDISLCGGLGACGPLLNRRITRRQRIFVGKRNEGNGGSDRRKQGRKRGVRLEVGIEKRRQK